ncbi:MAG TPA: hypothetical protein VLM76_00865 [Patescibacteria group bacterium]|nr:hypothetical protein [Patescibacteria group bacterium]
MGAGYWIPSGASGSLYAGELLSDVEVLSAVASTLGDAEVGVTQVTYSYALIVSQDCDLAWDHEAREFLRQPPPAASGPARTTWNEQLHMFRSKLMDSVLLCVADEPQVVRAASTLNKNEWQKARSNQYERYHQLRRAEVDEDVQGGGFPELTLDFKRFFALSAEEVAARVGLGIGEPGRASRRARLGTPYREDVLSRFYGYQARVALPDEDRPAS